MAFGISVSGPGRGSNLDGVHPGAGVQHVGRPARDLQVHPQHTQLGRHDERERLGDEAGIGAVP